MPAIYKGKRKRKKRKLKTGAHFNGEVYEPQFDKARLTGQILRVFDVMQDGRWRTLPEIEDAIWADHGVNDPHASISAQLRHLRKTKFGSHVVDKRPRGERTRGLWEYRLLANDHGDEP